MTETLTEDAVAVARKEDGVAVPGVVHALALTVALPLGLGWLAYAVSGYVDALAGAGFGLVAAFPLGCAAICALREGVEVVEGIGKASRRR